MDEKVGYEVMGIVGSSAIVAAFVTYIQNRRIEKLKMFSKPNAKYYESLIDGVNTLLSNYKQIITSIVDIQEKCDTGDFNTSTLKDYSIAQTEYVTSLRAHRVYLVPFLPFGDSNVYAGLQDLQAISMRLGLIFDPEVDDTSRSEDLEQLKISIKRLIKNYEYLSDRANRVVRDMANGKLRFIDQ